MLTPRKHTKIDEVAKAMRLSPKTVAGILQGDGRGTSRAIRERVRRVAERLGHPAPPGTSLLLMMSETPNYNIQSQRLLQGLAEGARVAKCRLEVAIVPNNRINNEAAIQALVQEHGVQGLLIHFHHEFPRVMPELLERLNVPAMWINGFHHHDCVMPGDYDAAMTLTRHLIELNHRRIAYADFTNDFTQHTLHHSCLERLDGYKQAMQEARLSTRLIGVELPIESQEQKRVIVDAMLATDAPTAVIGYSPQSTMPFYHLAPSELNRSIPEGLSLATFVNEENKTSGIDFTRMMTPWIAVGHAVISRLVARCAQPGKRFAPLMQPMEFIPGSTCRRWG
jgi:DNA-binding LacI/PurR family transcriptional regulator